MKLNNFKDVIELLTKTGVTSEKALKFILQEIDRINLEIQKIKEA